MKTIRNIAAVLLFSGAALASSHREAPAISNDPAADNTDVYAFVTTKNTTNDTLNIVANWIPFEEPSSGPNFFKWSDDVLYQIHITQGLGPIKDNIVYSFKFTTQQVPTSDKTLDANFFAFKCANPGTVGCVGGGKEFFAQLTGDLTQNPILNGGAIVQTYTVTKTVNGVDTPLVNTAFDNTPLKGAFVSVPWNIGPRTQTTLNSLAPNLVSSATYDDGNDTFAKGFIATTPASDGTRVFAGPRDDGFYVDLGGIFDLANLRPKAVAGDCVPANNGVVPGTPKCTKAQDGLAGYNVHSIALEIPTKQLTSVDLVANAGKPSAATTIGVWATSRRKKVSIIRANGQTSSYGPYVQVSRLGIPLVNEAIIGYQDKDKYNRTNPKDDVANFGAYILNPVIVPDAEAVGIYKALGITVTDKLRHGRTDIVDVISLAASGCTTYPTTPCHAFPSGAGALTDGSIGDVLRVDLALDPKTNGFPNGRAINNGAQPNQEQADVTDVELSLLLGGIPALTQNGDTGHPPLIQDHVDYNDKNFQTTFPWLATPWEGFSQGHGRVTP